MKSDNDQVRRLGEAATRAAPLKDAWTWSWVAYMLFVQGDFDEAIERGRKSLSIMDHGVGRLSLGLALYGKAAELVRQGRRDAAEPSSREAMALAPNGDEVIRRFEGAGGRVRPLAPIVRSRMSTPR